MFLHIFLECVVTPTRPAGPPDVVFTGSLARNARGDTVCYSVLDHASSCDEKRIIVEAANPLVRNGGIDRLVANKYHQQNEMPTRPALTFGIHVRPSPRYMYFNCPPSPPHALSLCCLLLLQVARIFSLVKVGQCRPVAAS